MIDRLFDPDHGFCVIDAGGRGLAALAAYLDDQLESRCRHIAVFEDHPDWKPIGVDPDIEDYRVGGTGFIPLHIDFVNASAPPDIVAFFCERQDEMLGGRSLLSSVATLLAALDPSEVEALRATRISEGKFFDLSNVGEELKDFPLLDGRLLRFTGKKIRENIAREDAAIMRRVEEVSISSAERVALAGGEVLLVNQRLCLHGRESLVRQPDGTFSNGRLLHQRFYRMIE